MFESFLPLKGGSPDAHTEISYELGFSSSAHFSYAFRARFNSSPKEAS